MERPASPAGPGRRLDHRSVAPGEDSVVHRGELAVRPRIRSLTRHYERCIPFRYHIGMSTQIAVRLPDDMVKFVDHLVQTGRASSRATVITRALERERRHEMAVQDAAIYAASGDDSDMVDLVRYLSGHPVDPDQ
jgi:Arc/MetJ-type ribon-helix-helix transcriptional regulator